MNFGAIIQKTKNCFLGLLLLSPFFLHAETEVTFTRVGPNDVEVESNGEKTVLHDSASSSQSQQQQPVLVPVQTMVRPATSGKVLSTPLVPVDDETEFPPAADAGQIYNSSAPYDTLVPKTGEEEAVKLPTENEETIDRLKQELDDTRRELARVSHVINAPIIISLHGQSMQLQWAEAKQEISIPRDGVVKIQLAPH